MNITQLKAAFTLAKFQLVASGWTKSHTLMSGGASADYGMCYIKDGRKFYLNKDTVANLPI